MKQDNKELEPRTKTPAEVGREMKFDVKEVTIPDGRRASFVRYASLRAMTTQFPEEYLTWVSVDELMYGCINQLPEKYVKRLSQEEIMENMPWVNLA